MKHPSFEYLLVALVAAALVLLLTPAARRLAIRWGAVAAPRDRDVHAVAIPRMGGAAIFVGLALAVYLASRLPTLSDAFHTGPEMPWVILAAAVICLVGIIDDRYELDSLTKLAGQVLASGIMVTVGGVQIGQFVVPWGEHSTFVLGADLAIPVTIVFTVLTVNALNFIDGLDGLAAGTTLIAAIAFFAYSYHVAQREGGEYVSSATLLAAVLAGACLGFLPHNFFPARVFMGDSGSMVLGLILAAATTTATTTTDPQVYQQAFGSLPLLLPLLIPASVLALPLVDLVLAVIRRVSKRRSPFAPDKQHLHHRLLQLGHTHRRAVLLLYFWSALIAFAGVGLSFEHGEMLVVTLLCTFAALGVLASVLPTLRARGARRRLARQQRRRPDAPRHEGLRDGSKPTDRSATDPDSVAGGLPR